MKSEIKGLKSDISGIHNEITGLKSDMKSMKSEAKGMKSEIKGIKTEIKDMKADMSIMKTEMSNMNGRMDEQTMILRALEHSAEVNKSTHDVMQNDIAHIKGDVENIKDRIWTVEVVTAGNWKDIAQLRMAK